MQFNDNVITEITAPNNVPFQPGFDIIGFGTEIPPEMAAENFDAAIIFYTDDWDPTATNPRVKFYFIGSKGGALITGYGYSENPSTTPTATVVRAQNMAVNNTTGDGLTDFFLRQAQTLNQLIFRITEGALGTTMSLYDGGGGRYFVIQPASGGNSCDLLVVQGPTQNVIVAWDGDLETFRFITSTLGYGNWVPCTYANGWGPAAPNFNRRAGVAVYRDPTGTVHMTGVADGGTYTPGTYIVQLPSSAYWPEYGKIIPVHTQNASGIAFIAIDSGNGAITIVGPNTPAGEMNFEATWTTQS